MKVLVVGANGQIGKQLVELLQNSKEFSVCAMVRKQEQADQLIKKGIEAVVADLEKSVEVLTNAVKGADAIVFTAGSGGSTGSDKTLLIDLDGAVKTMEAAEKAGVKRYIMVSALQANNRENWNENLRPYYVAKHYADKMLTQSSLDYTIIRPGGLLNEDGMNKIKAGEKLERGTIPRADVAQTIMASIKNKNTMKKAFDIISGETSIEESLQQI
ncbi:SDR family oxidoreductase [Metabacillus litoralis]|uniref:SDR family oxidoreductase n=1 Tax=Metabacillus litoralis TaxID=152268 RepID=UPI001CFDD800|nr:SDR family oxidoreductase [Metabacillus litoralis]